MHKANQFMEAADMVRELADENADLADAYVTLCVHAGIAASDVLCCAALVNTPRARTTMKRSACWQGQTRTQRST